MPSDNLMTRVHSGERVISADGVLVGHVWRVHFRDTEACIEIHPRSFWNTFADVFALRQQQTNTSHRFLPGRTVTQVEGKRAHVRLDAEAVKACVSRPPWIEREEIPPTGFNSGRLE